MIEVFMLINIKEKSPIKHQNVQDENYPSSEDIIKDLSIFRISRSIAVGNWVRKYFS